MKYLFMLLLVLPWNIYSQSAMYYKHLRDYNLKGPVKQYIENTVYEVDTFLFNEKGFLVENKHLNIHRKEFRKTTYQYQDTFLVSTVYTKDSIADTYRYFRDSLNRYVLETLNGDTSEITTYDDRGNTTEFFAYERDGRIKAHMVQVFDDSNKLTERFVTWSMEERNSHTYFWYYGEYTIHVSASYFTPLMIVESKNERVATEWIFDMDFPLYPMVKYKSVWIKDTMGRTRQYYTEFLLPADRYKEILKPGYKIITDYSREYDNNGNVIKTISEGEYNYIDTCIITYYE